MDKVHKILLVEDEVKLNNIICSELKTLGYDAHSAYDALAAEKLFSKNMYSFILLDIGLPGKSGLELCREFRNANKSVTIIMLTALSDVQDKLDAFAAGADDYIVKPFHFQELFARIHVLRKRRYQERANEETSYIIDDLVIDISTKTVTRSNIEITLTSKEFSLLLHLVKNGEKVTSKKEILEKVWDLNFDTGTNTIEVYISFLRNKIDKPFGKKLIHTKPGFGYYVK